MQLVTADMNTRRDGIVSSTEPGVAWTEIPAVPSWSLLLR